MKPGTIANRLAKVLSIALALGVLGYLVYCAHDAAKGTTRKTYMPSSKATPFEPAPGELVTEEIKEEPGNKSGKNKKNKKNKKKKGEE